MTNFDTCGVFSKWEFWALGGVWSDNLSRFRAFVI
jgi:hypothetical protein